MTTEEKPTILLIHGSWHTPLHYRHLIDALRARGHPVLAPVLPTTGHDDSIDGKTFLDAASQVRGLLVPYLDQDRKVVIVAHSFGGIVTAHIVAGLSLEERSAQGLKGGVTSIVYIAAQLSPENLRFKPGNAPPFFEWIDQNKHSLPADFARSILYNDVEEPWLDEALRLLVWQSLASCDPDNTYSASEIRVPKTYIVCTNDKIVELESQHKLAEIAGATVVELESGHSPFLVKKAIEPLVDIITKGSQ
ncbi:Alpha/beta hydrolase fold-1 [Hypoxylon fragiforme]|uniref:Alpha/beta hydrolase fold-1 n=1 Tax=Hypoxylon fragiforme TaxID=63214 RepID=UPI0020C747C1|nr:Alpha/beta hydrolase fold-1 [Hypoxylon fragiforme]KAI2614732.1 Alpha/beta hydrolase fold-1 [Hypoxylon fragiforme]